MKSSVTTIKREQKKSLYRQKLSEILYELGDQEPLIRNVYITHVDLSADTGICYVFFGSYPDPANDDLTVFNNAVEKLKLYKPSIRSVFAQRVRSRYTPDFWFKYNENQEDLRNINNLLDQVQQELHATDAAEQAGDEITEE